MKVYLSVDMEGIGGIGHAAPTERNDRGYPAAVELAPDAPTAYRGFLAGIRLVALLDLPPG
ncbi:MAG TPA: M55 family metallopeptidase [Candidatus Limnocylindrales bacterium]|nr:M55 family metallopeptidase [Candidatus Limnocylindrales bacterium]